MDDMEQLTIDAAKVLVSGAVGVTFNDPRNSSYARNRRIMDRLFSYKRGKREATGESVSYSDFWFEDGPRPASPEDMATWVADVAQKASACALPADHPVCHVTEAVAIAKVVAKAMDLRASNSVPRKWKIIEEGVAEIMAKQAKEES